MDDANPTEYGRISWIVADGIETRLNMDGKKFGCSRCQPGFQRFIRLIGAIKDSCKQEFRRRIYRTVTQELAPLFEHGQRRPPIALLQTKPCTIRFEHTGH